MSWIAVVIKYLPAILKVLQSDAFKELMEELAKLLADFGKAFEQERKAG